MLFKDLLLCCLVLSAGLAVPGHAAAAAAGGADVVAQAGTEALSPGDVRAAVAGLTPAERAAATSNLGSLDQLVRAVVTRKALLAEAKAKGFDRQPATQTRLEGMRDDALVRLWVASQTEAPQGYPSEDDIKSAYESNRQALAAPTEYRLAQIFVNAPDGGDPAKMTVALRKAADIAGRIAKADFSQLAQEQSEHAESAGKGGDLGFIAENKLPTEIIAVARKLQPGEAVGPIKTPQGLHFLKLLDRKPGAVPSLAEVHDRLAEALRSRRSAELQQSYLTALNAKLGITVNQIELARLQPTLK